MNTLEEKIISIVKEESDLKTAADHLDTQTDLKELGINSIMFIKIIVRIEEEFDMVVDDDYLTLDSLNTVADLTEMVRRECGE